MLGREFNLANDGLSRGAGLYQWSSVDRHTGADHDQVLAAEGTLAVAASFHRDSMVEQDWDFIAELVGRLRVRNRHPGTALFQKESRSHARLPEAYHQHAFVFEIHESSVLPRSRETRTQTVADHTLSSQLQCRQCEQSKHEGRDPETYDHFRLRPSQ